MKDIESVETKKPSRSKWLYISSNTKVSNLVKRVRHDSESKPKVVSRRKKRVEIQKHFPSKTRNFSPSSSRLPRLIPNRISLKTSRTKGGKEKVTNDQNLNACTKKTRTAKKAALQVIGIWTGKTATKIENKNTDLAIRRSEKEKTKRILPYKVKDVKVVLTRVKSPETEPTNIGMAATLDNELKSRVMPSAQDLTESGFNLSTGVWTEKGPYRSKKRSKSTAACSVASSLKSARRKLAEMRRVSLSEMYDYPDEYAQTSEKVSSICKK